MKSFVTMEQNVCPICCKAFSTGVILMDNRMRDKFERNTVTGWGLCPEHQALYDEGFMALVAVDEAKSKISPDGIITPDGAYRTGTVAHVRRTVVDRLFRAPIPQEQPLMFCEPELIDKLQAMVDDAPAK